MSELSSHALDENSLLEEWESLAAKLKAEVGRWSESDCCARQEAERSRNVAEAERNAAQEVRREAMLALINEQARRAAAEHRQLQLQADKAQLAGKLEQERERGEQLAGQVQALQVQVQRLEKAAGRVHELEGRLGEVEEALSGATQQAAAWESRCCTLEEAGRRVEEEAWAGVAAARREAALQEGLKHKAELATQEAVREVEQAQAALSAAEVEKQLLADRLETLLRVNEQLAHENEALTARVSELEATSAAAEQQASEAAQQRVGELEAALHDARAEAEAARAEVEAARAEADAEASEALLLSKALEGAEQSHQEMRAAWRRAENALHEMSRARAEAEQGKHRLVEALVKERAARILAQQELERLVGGGAGAGGGKGTSADADEDAEQARLALLYDELTNEHRALDLILEALREFKAQQPPLSGPAATPAPSTPHKV